MKQVFNFLVCVCILLTATVISLELNAERTIINTHQCDWEDCELVGLEMDQHKFVSKWGAEEMTDAWCVEITHFINPELTYEQCEDYVFSGVE